MQYIFYLSQMWRLTGGVCSDKIKSVMKREQQYQRISQYITAQYGVAAEHLWKKYPEFAVFRNPHGGKWFGLLMKVAARNLGLDEEGELWVINVHCAPVLLSTVLRDGDFLPGYHMNKTSWSTIILDDRLTDAQIFPLVHASYESVAKRPRMTPTPRR